jgi:hypothetical protein
MQEKLENLFFRDKEIGKLSQYRLWSFKSWNKKLERFLPKKKKILNFENFEF